MHSENTKTLPSLFDKCHNYTRADEVKKRGIYPWFRPIQESEGPVVKMEGKPVIMAGSNNYLGLTAHPKVKEAAIRALDKYGTSCSGSRFLTGTIELHEQLEARLARFVGKEAALLFSTGYQTSQGVIQPLVKRGDYILSDKDNHASIVAGNLMAKGGTGVNVIRYKHEDMADLEKRLSSIPLEKGKLIVTDGVFSTFGNVANVPEITKLAKKYNAQTLLDDAHAFGVVGEGGRGSASKFGLIDDVDMVMCTFSKTLASLGGFVAGDERVINYLKHHSPALIFSASPTPPSVAAALAALDILEQEPERVQQLYENANFVREGLKDAGFHVIDGETAIVPVLIGDDEQAFKLWTGLFKAGIFVNVFIAPATPPGKAMMRNSFMATHKREHLEKVVETYRSIGKQVGII
ncbi:MAG: aminotransferase class I/II-fold pyridoxal phosphate-dependent enzyme [Saprospiraceae bacterium]|nr:aminotransferase class I/II-fold pyridoxal phosphate-dependent enzyme [Saprospiraceae bacterium]